MKGDTTMFFNISKLKKMFKEAYKTGGLTVAHLEDGEYYIAHAEGVWKIKYREDCMPKEVKGALIELIGDLPELDTTLVACEDEDPQYEFVDTFGIIDKDFDYNPKTVTEYMVTHIANSHDGYIYVAKKDSNEPVKALRDLFTDAISTKNLEEKEMKPYGPYKISTSPYLIWQNYQCTYIILPHNTQVEAELKIRKFIGEGLYQKEE